MNFAARSRLVLSTSLSRGGSRLTQRKGLMRATTNERRYGLTRPRSFSFFTADHHRGPFLVILDSRTEWIIGKGLESPENRMVGARPFAPSRWRPRNGAPGIVKIPVRMQIERTFLSLQPRKGCNAQLRRGIRDQRDRLFGLVAGHGTLWDGTGNSVFSVPRR